MKDEKEMPELELELETVQPEKSNEEKMEQLLEKLREVDDKISNKLAKKNKTLSTLPTVSIISHHSPYIIF